MNNKVKTCFFFFFKFLCLEGLELGAGGNAVRSISSAAVNREVISPLCEHGCPGASWLGTATHNPAVSFIRPATAVCSTVLNSGLSLLFIGMHVLKSEKCLLMSLAAFPGVR